MCKIYIKVINPQIQMDPRGSEKCPENFKKETKMTYFCLKRRSKGDQFSAKG